VNEEKDMRLKLEPGDDDPIQSVKDKFEVLDAMLVHIKNTRGDVDGRGLALTITHLQTAALWFKDAVEKEA